MAEREYDTRDGEIMLADAREEDFGARMQANSLIVPPAQQQLAMRQVGDLFGSVTTAQPVIKERDIGKLMQTLKILAESFGDDYIYSWRVNDKNSKESDGKTTIEGPTINLTNDLAREYGNCIVEPREIEGPNHWVFYGRFTDLQTGYSLTRAFRQRKNALAGNYENDRKLDMAYQMGQSKCLRNVVVNALRNYCDFMVRIAKGALIKKITADPSFYLERINGGLPKYGISLKDAEGLVGLPQAQWNPHDIAKVFSALKGVAEGLVDPREAFPSKAPIVPNEDQDQQTAGGSESRGGTGDGTPYTSSEAESAGVQGSREAPPPPADDADKKPAAAKAKPKASPAPSPTPAPAPSPIPSPTPKPAAKKPAALF